MALGKYWINIGTGKGIAVRTVIESLADYFSARALVHFGVVPLAAGGPPPLVADMTKAQRILGWRAPTDIASDLRLILEKKAADPCSGQAP